MARAAVASVNAPRRISSAGSLLLPLVEPWGLGCAGDALEDNELLIERLSTLAGRLDAVPPSVQISAREAFRGVPSKTDDHGVADLMLVIRERIVWPRQSG